MPTAIIAPRRKPRERLVLPLTEARRIRQRLTGMLNGQACRQGYVCSEPWARECLRALESGKVQPRKKMRNLEDDFYKSGVYPPGGPATSMIEHPETMRYMPPDYNGECVDAREDELTIGRGCQYPRSVSAVMIDRIRFTKARPEKMQLRRKRG